jgi:2-keto-4-pentenoate hydratase
MLNTAELQTIANQIRTAQDQALLLTPITSQYTGFDGAAAYDVANMVHTMRLAGGARAVGRKIGFTNSAMWTQYDVSAPVWAHVYDTTVTYLPDASSLPATCSLSGFVQPKIEPEVVFHFRAAPPPDGDMAAVLACIDWVAHGFEMVQSPYPDWKFQAPDAIAVGGLHARLLVGKRQPVDALGPGLESALAAFSLALSEGGRLIETGKGANVLGNPLAAVVHLMRVLASQLPHRPLQAGELVTTGTVTSAYPVQAGQTWRTELGGIALPGLTIRLTD